MDLSKFTVKSQATLTEAQNIAARNQHQAVDVELIVQTPLGRYPPVVLKARTGPKLAAPVELPAAQPDLSVLEVFQRGYRRGQEVFRPAKVVVNDLNQPHKAGPAKHAS